MTQSLLEEFLELLQEHRLNMMTRLRQGVAESGRYLWT